MSESQVPKTIVARLWGMAGGRCEFEGCNIPLWRDSVTRSTINKAYVAHIISDKPDGWRGHPVLSEKLKKSLSNLMLLCDEHHRRIDCRSGVIEYPVNRLTDMKKQHEQRIELLTEIQPEKQSEVLLYGASIGEHTAHVTYEKAAIAMIPERYPARSSGIALGLLRSCEEDRTAEFWSAETRNLCSLYTRYVKKPLQDGHISHMSIFAHAPQPLLMLLGYLISDIPAADVYQLHREPPDWCWQESRERFRFVVTRPKTYHKDVAIKLALSDKIEQSRIDKVLPSPYSTYTVSIRNPNNDFLKSKKQLQQFRELMRPLLGEIKLKHGEDAVLHVFPAAPVAVAVEFGRIIMPKAALVTRIYDQNWKLGGFSFALQLPPQKSLEPQQ